jgi:hypothetical protein
VSFEDLAFLLLPAEPGQTGTTIVTGDRWTPVPTGGLEHDVVVWGRGPLRSGTPVALAGLSALRRERALASLRKPTPPILTVRVHRLPPQRLARGQVRNRLRTALLGGALVELWRSSSVRRVIDAVAEQARTADPVTRFAAGSGGSAIVRLPTADGGGRFVLRVARKGSPGDPSRAADALAILLPLGLGPVPRLIDRGETAGASWSTESLLSGRRPRHISTNMAAEIARLCSALPRSDEPATAHQEDLLSVAGRFPQWEKLLNSAGEELRDVARAVPSVARHGDLWAGNILVRRDHVSGVVDWDAWHPAAFPGVDLVHLVAMDEADRRHGGLGRVWLGRPWLSDRFRSIAIEYWASLRLVPNSRFLEMLGVAWWANQVAASLRRLPHLADDDRWVSWNVDVVMESLAGRS